MKLSTVFALAVAGLVLLLSPVSASVIHVKWDSPGPSFDGKSWDSAYHRIQEGLDAAVSGDEVWVSKGTYAERITLRNAIALYGGFAGNESGRDQRDWHRNASVVDGGKAGTVVTVAEGADSRTVIDGFTIQNGSGTLGGGIYCRSCNPMIAHNTIAYNEADQGGGINCSLGGPVIACNTLIGNRSGSAGGAIYIESSNASVYNNVISGNASCYGGGIYLTGSSAAPIITNNTIVGNTADDHGGGGIYSTSPASIGNNIVAYNSSGIMATPGQTLRKNCVYNPDGTNYEGGVQVPADEITADPKLAAYALGRAHLQLDSPCIDAGDDAIAPTQWADIDGDPRMLGGRVDIGADESDGRTWDTAPAIVRVSTSGDDSNDGSSWDRTKRTVQAAIDAASTAGGEVWIAKGDYDGLLQLRPYVSLYGGFAGSETSSSERDWKSNASILDGKTQGPVVTVDTGHNFAIIDGLTIRNGKGFLQDGVSHGGGIYAHGVSPTIRNNTFLKCTAYTDGAAVYCDGQTFVFHDNLVANNYGGSSTAAAVCCSAATVSVFRNRIVGNACRGLAVNTTAGAIYDNVVAGNAGDGIYSYSSATNSTTMIANNTIVSNEGTAIVGRNNITAANNICAFNSGGIGASNGTAPLMSHNCVYNPGGTDYPGNSDPRPTDISVDPKLTSPAYGEVHLSPESPCIDSGDDAAAQPDWMDIDAKDRKVGEHVDIGADEYDGATWTYTPTIVRVTPTGDDANDGLSWQKAKRSVQSAMDAAAPTGGEVWVAAGLYRENIALLSRICLYGGFAGAEESREARDPRRHPTNLVGNGTGSVVTIRTGRWTSLIDGFIISGGTYDVGAAIYCTSEATIKNNVIRGNSGATCAGVCASYCSPLIMGNTITGNSSTGTDGSGILCGGGSPVICSNIITNNIVTSAAVYCSGGSPTLTNNTIVGNNNDPIVGNRSTGIYCVNSSAVVSNNIVAYNRVGVTGSASTTLARNDVYQNLAANYSGLSAGSTDFSSDPKFVADAWGDLRIQPDSPCADTGSDAAVDAGWTDALGSARMNGDHVDIGACESDGVARAYAPTIVMVSPSGNDGNDGASWSTAKRSVQAALDAASTDGGEVWVAAGTYEERLDLRPFTYLYGGFKGTETQKSDRDWNANASVIDGGAAGAVAACYAYQYCGIDGFTIRNGRFTGIATGGAGINAPLSKLTITNNKVSSNAGIGIYGGYPVGNEVSGNSDIGITGCLQVVSNTVKDNASCGISSYDTVRQNVVSGNKGGGIRWTANTGTTGEISGNTVTDNTSDLGAGVYCISGAPPITGNTISGNAASTNGGGLYLLNTSAKVEGNSVSGNSAPSGAGICCKSGVIVLSCNTVTANVASSKGGGIYSYGSQTSLLNNCIARNKAEYGAGTCSDTNSSMSIINNTIVDNIASIQGGGIYRGLSTNSLTVKNNIIAWNSTGIYNAYSSSYPTLACNNVYGNTVDYGAGVPAHPTDISADPLFTNRASSDYYLLPGSPCIDKANPTSAPSADIDGTPRPKDGNGDGLARPDIGCYEAPAFYKSVGDARALADGMPVGLRPMTSTALFTDRFYIESADRISGIGVAGSCSSVGKRISVEGTMATTPDGERVVTPTSITEAEAYPVPAPLFLNFNCLGGGPAGLQEGVKDWRLVKKGDQWVRDIFCYGGPSNIGLLVKVAGEVKFTGEASSFYILGTCFDDGNASIKGVKVSWPFTEAMPADGSFVEMLAISSCTRSSGEVVRMLRPVSPQAVRALVQ